MIPSPPHILHAYKSYYPDEGGIPTIIQLIAEALTSSTHHQVLCTHNKLVGKTEVIHQVKVRRLASLGHLFSLPITPHYPLALWKLAHQFRILDYHFPMPWVDLAVASYLPKSTKLVIHWHSEIIAQKKLARLLAPMIHRCLQRADSIVVADKAHIDHSSWLSAYQDKCRVIPFGIDISKWQKISFSEEQKIQQLQKQYPSFVLAVGRLVPYKGFATLIDAMQFVDAALIIVGQGPLTTELQQLAAKRQLSHRVHFLGKTNHSDLKCLYHAAKLFALPSVTENEAFGMVQLEAMACGKPIINTALKSGVPHVARHQQEALTVPPYSVELLANAIKQILTTPDLAEKLAANGLQRVVNTYSLDSFLAETLKLYDSLM